MGFILAIGVFLLAIAEDIWMFLAGKSGLSIFQAWFILLGVILIIYFFRGYIISVFMYIVTFIRRLLHI
jgi:hypothetical protein